MNLRYISEHYGYAPDRVMKMRERGDHFLAIDRVADRETKGKDRYGCGEGKYGKDSKRQCKGSTRKGKEGDVYKRAPGNTQKHGDRKLRNPAERNQSKGRDKGKRDD